MDEGLLCFDNNPDLSLSDKIDAAARRYQLRLHHKPTVCYLNVADFDESVAEVNGIAIKPARFIRRHYLWLGIEREPLPPKAA